MGHCGNDGRGTLYSLRKRDKGKKGSKSYVTIAYNQDSATIFPNQSRQNLPPESLWPHIEKFIEISEAEFLEETGSIQMSPENLTDWVTTLTAKRVSNGRAESSNDTKISITNAKNT